jgi:small-conductance mechanosensitive channel
MDTENVQSVMEMIRVGGLFTAALIMAVSYVTARLVTTTLSRLGERLTERRLLFSQVSAFVRFGVYFVGIMLSLVSAVELRRETVLALSGTAGVALGFAFKDLASSVLAGLTILIDKPFQVGDRIKVGDTYGDVAAIGLRSVRIVTLDDNLVTIPNSRFLNDPVSSGNAGELNMLVQMDFHIDIDNDVDLAVRMVEETLTTSRYCFLDKPWVVLVSQVMLGDHFAVRLRAKAYVIDTKYEKAFESDVTRAVMRAFANSQIVPPGRLIRTAAPTAPTGPVRAA